MSSVIVVDSSDEDEASITSKNIHVSKKMECEKINLAKKCTVPNPLNAASVKINRQPVKKLITKAGIESALNNNKNVQNLMVNGVKKMQQITRPAPKLNSAIITKMNTTIKTAPSIVNSTHTQINMQQPTSMRKTNALKTQQMQLTNKTVTTASPTTTTGTATGTSTSIQTKTKLTLNAEAAIKAVKAIKPTSFKIMPIKTNISQLQEQMNKRKSTTIVAPTTATKTIVTTTANMNTSDASVIIRKQSQQQQQKIDVISSIRPNMINPKTQITMKKVPSNNVKTVNNPIKASTTTITPVILPNMQSFNRLDADALPPLQLMATPPHQSAALANNETTQSTISTAATTITTTATTITAQQLKKNFDNNNDCIVILPKPTTKSNQNVQTTTTTTKISNETSINEKISQELTNKKQIITNQNNNNNNNLKTKNIQQTITTLKKSLNEDKIKNNSIKPTAEKELMKQQEQQQLDTAIESISPKITTKLTPINSPEMKYAYTMDLTAITNTKTTNCVSPKLQDSIDLTELLTNSPPPAKRLKKIDDKPINLDDSPPPTPAPPPPPIILSSPAASPKATTEPLKIEKPIDLTQLSPNSSDLSENMEIDEEKHILANVFHSSSPSTSTCSLTSRKDKETTNEQTPEYISLLTALRKADNSADMERLIERKLNKYYNAVPFNFLKSKGFRKNMRLVIKQIESEPDLVYLHLKSVLEELKSRYRCKPTYMDEDDDVTIVNTEHEKEELSASENNDQSERSTNASTSAHDERRKHITLQIQQLNAALHKLTKKIDALEQAEVDLDDEDSPYLQEERLKKRACQIYNKICDLTGESKNAHRLMKKPIQFNGTSYPQFNKTLRAYINRTKEFPDYYDVLHMVEHCNKKYKFELAQFQIKRLAEDAFMQVGKLLQARRKTDLYETVSHYTANTSDPAKNDPELLAKLNENKKVNKRIGDIIAKYAREQERISEEHKSARLQEKSKQSTVRADYEAKLKEISDLVDQESNTEDDDEEEKQDSSDDTTQRECISSDKNIITNGTLKEHKEKKVFIWGKITSKKKATNLADDNSISASKTTGVCENLDKSNTATPKPNGQIEETIAFSTNKIPELKIVSVCSLNKSNPATPVVRQSTPPTIMSSATITTIPQERLSNEIWISDDDDELVTEEITTAK